MPDTEGAAAVLTATAWDYKVVSIHARHNEPLQEGLTEFGNQGWELVFVTMPMSNEYQCIFRRPRQ